jgi:hypothetical protein
MKISCRDFCASLRFLNDYTCRPAKGQAYGIKQKTARLRQSFVFAYQTVRIVRLKLSCEEAERIQCRQNFFKISAKLCCSIYEILWEIPEKKVSTLPAWVKPGKPLTACTSTTEYTSKQLSALTRKLFFHTQTLGQKDNIPIFVFLSGDFS